MASVISVNVGRPRTVSWKGRDVSTGIFKSPVHQPVRAEGDSLQGDGQADLRVHGGRDKAVYAFPSEHYPDWQHAYPDADFGWGAFGENLTTAGLIEDDVAIGDRYRCGSVELVVTQHRAPCFKLAIRLESDDAIKRMLETGHTGYYLAIDCPGTIQAGDALELMHRPDGALRIAEMTSLYYGANADAQALTSAANAPCLLDTWRTRLLERADKLQSPPPS